MKEAELGAAATIATDLSKCLKALTEDLVSCLQTRQFVKARDNRSIEGRYCSNWKITSSHQLPI
jgi:hypothetical protein